MLTSRNGRRSPLEIILSEVCQGSPTSICLQRLVSESICHVGDGGDDDDDDDDDDDEVQGIFDKGVAGVVLEAIDTDLHIYCTVSALLAMRDWPDRLVQQENTFRPAISLLDPHNPHFRFLRRIASGLDHHYKYFSWLSANPFWSIEWDLELTDGRAIFLTNILFLACDSPHGLSFAKKFILDEKVKDCLQTRLVFTYTFQFYNEFLERYVFDGNIIEVFANMTANHIEAFKLFLEYGAGLYDFSEILLLFIGSHDFHFDTPNHNCNDDCILQRLLASGANPNKGGSRVTSLQIAVYFWDLAAVVLLLIAGADVNNTGDISGAFWGHGTVMSRFNCLHNASPLYICRNFELNPTHFKRYDRKWNVQKIEDFLLSHGAKSFLKPTERLIETLKLHSNASEIII